MKWDFQCSCQYIKKKNQSTLSGGIQEGEEIRMIEGLVSIITPMHNSARTVAQTIESVQKQTYQNWEMIIVDDGSIDDGVELVQRYVHDDSRIRLYKNDKNVGVAFTRNIAVKKANGQYLAFLDSDDLWRSDKLEKQLQLMENTGCSFCYGMCGVIDNEGKNINKDRIVPRSIDFEQLLKGNDIPCLTVLLDRKVIKEVEMPNIPHEDYACWLTIFRKYDIVAYGLQEVVADYRIGEKSVSSNKFKVIGWTWNIYRNYLGLSLWKSASCFAWYVIKAVVKRI